ncbi:helix-turn-helix domain-containing protein [Mariniflexile sp.]|uniref:helix-turn-helix domain-containing protein n=1 Tax=Mariniflexile sp. TaxID=1979402 RepID=UPI004048C345
MPRFLFAENGHYVELLQPDIKRIFLTKDTSQIYHHFGNFNLKIADYVRQLNYCDHKGMVRSLIIEGCVNIILALQLAEHENFAENKKLPESLSKEDIVKIQKAAEMIQEHIHENLSVGKLAAMVQLTQARLQIGFKFLYQKTVNNYTKEIKLQAAHNYLMNSNLTVSEVVYKVGYSSRSYFTEIFFERFGILPNQYKKNFK